jgi:hypothetical protein
MHGACPHPSPKPTMARQHILRVYFIDTLIMSCGRSSVCIMRTGSSFHCIISAFQNKKAHMHAYILMPKITSPLKILILDSANLLTSWDRKVSFLGLVNADSQCGGAVIKILSH